MARSISRTRAVRRVAATTISTTALLLPAAAWAQCSASGANNATVSCSGTATSYTYTGTAPANITVNSGATVTAPLTATVAGSTLTNVGTVANTASAGGIVLGNNATVTNGTVTNGTVTTGTITSAGTASGATAITVGANSTVTNNGTLTATAGTPAVNFTGVNGTFVNSRFANAAVQGNIQYGANSGASIGTFINNNTAFGITGSVAGSGNLAVTNNGIFTGNILQSSITGSTVTVNNGSAGTFAGIINTGDVSNISNAGTMTLYGTTSLNSVIGSAQAGASTLTNTGTLAIGNQSSPTQVTVFGNFSQSSAGTLAISIASAGASLPIAGASYSQLYASDAGATLATAGNVALAGKLVVNVAAGFYPTNSVYNLILADKTITGTFSSVTTSTLVTTPPPTARACRPRSPPRTRWPSSPSRTAMWCRWPMASRPTRRSRPISNTPT